MQSIFRLTQFFLVRCFHSRPIWGLCPFLTFALVIVLSRLAAAESGVVDPVCRAPALGNGRQGSGTLKMIARLEEIARTSDPGQNVYLNSERVRMIERSIARSTNNVVSSGLRLQLANELLRAGEAEKSAREFEDVLAFVRSNGLSLNPQTKSDIGVRLGMAYMRIGEQQNCRTNFTIESCLFPIGPKGVHKLQSGSRSAIRVFTEHLKDNPNDLSARWLLNVAYMTVGEYPDHVPPQWVISPDLFKSEYDLPKFPNGAGAAGLDVDNLAGGCIAEDFDGDGLLDVMMSSWGMHGQLRFFHNNGDGRFVERTREAGLTGLTGGLNIMQTDYNNDGLPDVLVLRGAWLGKSGRQPRSLLRNNGDGTFEDVTESAGLLTFHPSQTATWFDFDNDGWLDLFIGNESWGTESHPCQLYHNNGDGTFTECSIESGVDIVAFVKGVNSGDYDNDGRPDLYLSVRGRPNLLLHNDGPAPGHSKEHPAWRFSDRSSKAGVGTQSFTFPTWFFDYDNDGFLDIFVSGYAATLNEMASDVLGLEHKGERARLYHNNGDGTFTDVSKPMGLYKLLHTMGSNYGDLDNDGWLDMYLGTGDPEFSTLIPNRAFRNDGGKRFQDVTTTTGMGHLQKGHGIAFADLDNDGDQDVFAMLGGAFESDTYRNALFVNPGNSNHWITLKLEGTICNRAAIGSRIKVNLSTGTGMRSVYKTVCSGGSFGASPLRQEIGLGGADSIKSVEIFWPASGKIQTITGLEMDRFYRIKEESIQADQYFPKKFKLMTNGPAFSSPHQGMGKGVQPNSK